MQLPYTMCSTITLRGMTTYMGHNYDTYSDHGLIIGNPANLCKTALSKVAPESPLTWTSIHESVTLCQYGRELPTCGMNIKGLAVAVMFQKDGLLPPKDERKTINELQWVQYQLDLYSSVSEVLAHLDDIRIEKIMYVLHYNVTDAMGNCAMIDFIDGKPVVTLNAELPVLTNRSYDWCAKRSAMVKDVPTDELPRTPSSRDRFIYGERLISTVANPSADETFRVLDGTFEKKVGARIKWDLSLSNTFTCWTVVFNTNDLEIKYKNLHNDSIRTIRLKDLTLDNPVCIKLDNGLQGDITDGFHPYKLVDNMRIVRKSYLPLIRYVSLCTQLTIARYPNTLTRCERVH